MYLAVGESLGGERRFFTGIVRDLSERVAAEAALAASEARHRALVEHAQVCIHELDLKGHFRSINRCGLEMLGHLDASAVVGQPYLAFVGEVDRSRIAGLIERAVRGESVTYEFEGAGRIFSCSLSPLGDGSGGVAELIGVSEDVTEQREAEAQLRESEQRLRAMFNQRVELAGFLNLDGTITDANERSLAMIGATRSEIVGREFWDTPWWEHNTALQERLRAAIARAAKGEFVRFEAQHPRSDGVMATVDFSLTPIRGADGAVEMLFAESVEITDQRRAESELRDSEERFRTLATNVPVAIFQADPRGECVYVNPRWCEIAGVPEDEALGKGWAQALHPDDRDRLAKEWGELTASGLDVLPLSDRRFRRPDGRVTWLAGSAVSLRDESGDLTGYIGTLMDLTEQRRAQEAEKLASIATLTAGIAHDVGAPMTAILGYAEMMQKSLTDEKNQRRAGIIVEQVKRISELIQALLNMARPSTRAFIRLELGQVLDKSLEFYREKLRSRGIEVERFFEAVPSVAGDPDRLQQVFLNLVINAADAMPDGGTLRVTLRSADARHVEVRFSDTGTGIPPDDLTRIFEPFYTTKERGGGTGLGLIVARTIIDEHNGVISVESEVESGTEFTIRFDLRA
jgi:PAS domain S-box-containing protein